MSQNHCVKHTACPNCKRSGNDNGNDNLAVYSDGSSFCFRCGYFETTTGIRKLKQAVSMASGRSRKPVRELQLPSDVTDELSQCATRFLGQYALTENDAKRHTILWSEYNQRLIFPYFDDTGLLAWQGRHLGNEEGKAKWFSQGNLQEVVHLVGNRNSRICVVVEDIVSAIKVAHCSKVCVNPLFGSHISVKRILQLRYFFDTLVIWLDDDVKTKVVKFASTAQSLGLDTKVVLTSEDPKALNDVQISDILNQKLTKEYLND